MLGLAAAISSARAVAAAFVAACYRATFVLPASLAIARAGMVMSINAWKLVRHPDRRIDLAIPEMLQELRALSSETLPGTDYPFILMAGERRSYNANQIYRHPAWRKVDRDGAMRLHPEDAATLGLSDGAKAMCRSATGELQVTVELDDNLRRGTATLPHGYGQRFADGEPTGPQLNRLTTGAHCDPLTRTPYHKYVPVFIEAVAG